MGQADRPVIQSQGAIRQGTPRQLGVPPLLASMAAAQASASAVQAAPLSKPLTRTAVVAAVVLMALFVHHAPLAVVVMAAAAALMAGVQASAVQKVEVVSALWPQQAQTLKPCCPSPCCPLWQLQNRGGQRHIPP